MHNMTNVNNELEKLLSKLDQDTLFSLAKNVTQDLKKSNTLEEAIENIIKYSQDAISILRKKVITKEILFNYLEENNIKIRLPTTKNQLIDKIIETWGISATCVHMEENTISENCSNNTTESNEIQQQIEANNVNLLGTQFAKWFYSMLNTNSCGSEHFFVDIKFQLNTYTDQLPNAQNVTIENNPGEIINIFTKIHMQYQLFFNVNLSPGGIQTKIDEHGLVLVMACGSLHSHKTCVGIFEQMFALARDPFTENNWKIKKTELNLRFQGKLSQIQQSQHSICESSN